MEIISRLRIWAFFSTVAIIGIVSLYGMEENESVAESPRSLKNRQYDILIDQAIEAFKGGVLTEKQVGTVVGGPFVDAGILLGRVRRVAPNIIKEAHRVIEKGAQALKYEIENAIAGLSLIIVGSCGMLDEVREAQRLRKELESLKTASTTQVQAIDSEIIDKLVANTATRDEIEDFTKRYLEYKKNDLAKASFVESEILGFSHRFVERIDREVLSEGSGASSDKIDIAIATTKLISATMCENFIKKMVNEYLARLEELQKQTQTTVLQEPAVIAPVITTPSDDGGASDFVPLTVSTGEAGNNALYQAAGLDKKIEKPSGIPRWLKAAGAVVGVAGLSKLLHEYLTAEKKEVGLESNLGTKDRGS